MTLGKNLIRKFNKKILLSFLALILTTLGVTFPNQAAHAAPSNILEILNLQVTPLTIKITYTLEPGCPTGDPQLQIINKENVVISKSNPPQSTDTPLTAMLLQEFQANCTRKITEKTAIISFPNELQLSNLTAFKFPILRNPDNVANPVTTSTRELRFVAMTQDPMFSGNGIPDFKLEEFWFQPGKEPIRTVLGDKNINAILGTTKDGVIVKTFTNDEIIKTWLVTNKKWELLSSKPIYIEPGTISKDKKWLLGRKVADGPSTRFYAQNLTTGTVSILFDVTKNGGGYICGGMSDEAQKYAYFSHVATAKTLVYRVDLATRKIKSVGRAMSGFCVSDVMEDGRLVGVVRDSKRQTKYVILADSNHPDTARTSQAPSFVTAGDANSQAYAIDSMMILSDLIQSRLYVMDYNDREFLWEGPIQVPTNLQFLNPIPTSWRSTTERPKQP